ncbi:uncharacterized protein LOC106876247 [Octopus bimaculoides]|uniref:uncharacterized protein LOC106876247 n=1 Tax=Octopus bimaculoides TaxID=37653 RepID=UPI00071E1D5F|nr:uncharacterized protein LOC106876247 [Octopus bimaculoides]|eukprot:XP_014780225.1 PREDICTED: uncharacterized protein LOC106876247 [Octopus bimaculoides]
MPQCQNNNVDSDDEEIITGVCKACNTSLLTSKHLLSAIEVDGIMKSSGVSYNATPPSIDNLTGENKRLSKKLYKHWYDVEMSSSEEEEEVGEEEEVEGGEVNGRDDVQDSSNSTPKETPIKSFVSISVII